MKVNTFNIYVLKLIENKYYIGKTSKNIFTRFYEHRKGDGSVWTKLYRPIRMIEYFQTTNKFHEDMYTKKYMDKFGIDNVRGGSYSNIELNDYQLKVLEIEFRTANDLCFKCGNPGHLSFQCKNI